jgi:hypothetical protein
MKSTGIERNIGDPAIQSYCAIWLYGVTQVGSKLAAVQWRICLGNEYE